jgi:hypothetical protein
MEERDNPSTRSSDYVAMQPFWEQVAALSGGITTMRKGGEKYLPKFPSETDHEYKQRLGTAKFTNIYSDIVENLSARPFGDPVTVADASSSELVEFSEDVDGKGNNLHRFAADVFQNGISKGLDWVLVDYVNSNLPPNASVAEERAAGVRPIWRRYGASDVIAVYSAQVGGKEEFVHARFLETSVQRDGFAEVSKDRIRVLDREDLGNGRYGLATWTLYERQKGRDGKENWVVIQGPTALTVGFIPLVPFVTGKRQGSSWRVRPPMKDAADLQVDLYQQENGLKNAKTLTAFPMLAADGVDPPIGDDGNLAHLEVGPSTVLFGGAGEGGGGSWKYVEPAATSLRFLADDIKDCIQQLRELGRQPLTAQSGNLTRITTAVAAEKANSAVQAWALNLQDALELAFLYTAAWLRITTPSVQVDINVDFDLSYGEDDTFGQVLLMGVGDAPLISREAVLHEAKRRGILDKAFDPDADLEKLLESMAVDDDNDE